MQLRIRKSPKHYEQIYLHCKSQIKDIENTYKVKDVNTCYFPSIINFLLTYHMSGIILFRLCGKKDNTVSRVGFKYNFLSTCTCT